MRSTIRLLLPALMAIGLGFLACSVQAVAASPGNSLALSFSLEKGTVALHEPVLVRLRADNGSDRPMRLDLGFDRVGNLRFVIAGPGEERIHVVPHLHPGLVRFGLVTVDPGKSYTQDILLSALYTFSAEGSYAIQVSLTPSSPLAKQNWPGAYKPKQMSLRVLPRNPSQLRRVCADLVEKIMSENAGSVLESAKALSYVNDLVAVPYLERAAMHGSFNPVVRPIAIDGLARISLTWGKKRVLSFLTQKDPRIEAEISAHMTTLPKRAASSPH